LYPHFWFLAFLRIMLECLEAVQLDVPPTWKYTFCPSCHYNLVAPPTFFYFFQPASLASFLFFIFGSFHPHSREFAISPWPCKLLLPMQEFTADLKHRVRGTWRDAELVDIRKKGRYCKLSYGRAKEESVGARPKIKKAPSVAEPLWTSGAQLMRASVSLISKTVKRRSTCHDEAWYQLKHGF